MQILDGSLFWRLLCALDRWFGGQWRRSRVVQWFLHPSVWDKSLSEESVFYKLWDLIRRGLCRLYEKLRLEKLFRGSVFLHTCFWCALPVVIAPLWDFFRPSLVVAGLVIVGALSLLLNLVRDRERQLAWSPINRYVILYAAIYLAAVFFSVSPRASLEPGLLSVLLILFAVVLGSAFSTRKQLDAVILLMVLAATLVSFYGILQYLFGWGYQSEAWIDSDMFSSTFRVISTLQNPNMLGQYLILMIPLGGAGLLSAKSWGKRIFYFCCCGVMCLCMILTLSRGAWLGLLFAGALFFLLLNPRLILLAPFLLAALYFVLPETVISRFTSIGNMADNSTSYRFSIWMGAIAMLKDYWLCGIGPGTDVFNAVYPAYGYDGANAQHAHNLYLQIVSDAGIAALAVFLLLLFVYFRTLCSAMSREKRWDSRLLQIAFASGVFGFLVQAMTDYSFYNYRVLFLFWAYLALGALCARRSELPEEGRRVRP